MFTLHRTDMLLKLVLFLPAVFAFNLDLRFPHIYHHSSGEPSDYFGFNVALHPGSSKPGDRPWMMVGAPKRNNSQYPSTQIRNSGVVTICPFNNTCTKIDLSRGGYPNQNLNGEMLGSVQDVRDGFVLTCAPRWMILDNSANQEKYRLFGTCYQAAAANLNSFFNITPLANDIGNLASKTKSGRGSTIQPYFLYGEAGFSAHYSQNFMNTKKLVLGAPGIFNWKGSTVLYNINLQGPEISKPIIHNPQESYHIPPFALFGYAVTSGRFFQRGEIHHAAGAPRSKQSGQVFLYAFPTQSHAGIIHRQTLEGPHAGSYFGAALAACDINGDSFDDLIVGAPMYSSQLSEDHQDQGAVFIYLANPNSASFGSRADIFLTNPSMAENGRFGTTVSCVGDLDQDGFQDVAISAPFERHADPYATSGVVYIYSGSKSFSKTPSQVIRASEVFQQRSSRNDFPPLQGFGYSISRGQDVDGNGYPDLAIGAYISGHAVILRSQPVVFLSVSMSYDDEGSALSIPRNTKEVNIQICPTYKGKWLPHSLQVTQIVEVDSKYKRLNTGNPTSLVEIIKDEKDDPYINCQRMKLTFHNNVQNFLEPIPIKVIYKLPNDSFDSTPVLFTEQRKLQTKDYFCSSCPITDPNSRQVEGSMRLLFATDCGRNNICLANLSLHVNFITTTNTKSYVIGSPTHPMLHVSVTNAANSNPAYNARVVIKLPTNAMFLPQGCNKDSNDENEVDSRATKIICEIGNPLQPNQTRILQLGLDMSSVSGAQGSLVASVQAFTSSTNLGTVGQVTDTLDLAAIADITVSGKSGKEQYYFDTEEEEDETKWEIPFDLTYQVEKLGISPVDTVLFSLQIPTSTKKSKKFLERISKEVYVDDRQIMCLNGTSEETSQEKRQNSLSPPPLKYPANRTMFVSCSRNDDWICESFSCLMGPFTSTQATARIQLTVRLNTKVLESMLGRRDIIVFETDAHVVIKQPNYIRQPDKDMSDYAVVTATLIGRVPDGHVEPWVLALSVIGGVLILLVLITGLVKAGFFERKEKKALVELKRKTQMDLEEYQRVSAMQHMENMDDDDVE